MKANDYARRCVKRLLPAPDEENELIVDWGVFVDMLRATAAHVPTKLYFDDDSLIREQDYLARLDAEQVDPVEDRRRLTPHAVTVEQQRACVEAIHVLRALWSAFTDYFAAEDARDADAKTRALALARIVALSAKYPGVYWRLDVHFQGQVYGEAEVSQTPEYRRYYEAFHPPHTWIVNGGAGMEKSIFPPYDIERA
jgi:hypothetical protein